MKPKIFIVAILTISIISIIGCATFNDYKAKTTDEEEIKVAFQKYWEEWDNHDSEGVLSFIHGNAQIMTGRERLVVSKKQFSGILPERFKKSIKFRKGSPKMIIKGDEAVVIVPYRSGNINLLVTYNLVRENNNWYIMSTKY